MHLIWILVTYFGRPNHRLPRLSLSCHTDIWGLAINYYRELDMQCSAYGGNILYPVSIIDCNYSAKPQSISFFLWLSASAHFSCSTISTFPILTYRHLFSPPTCYRNDKSWADQLWLDQFRFIFWRFTFDSHSSYFQSQVSISWCHTFYWPEPSKSPCFGKHWFFLFDWFFFARILANFADKMNRQLSSFACPQDLTFDLSEKSSSFWNDYLWIVGCRPGSSRPSFTHQMYSSQNLKSLLVIRC